MASMVDLFAKNDTIDSPLTFVATGKSRSTNGFLLDSGATHHLTNTEDNLMNNTPYYGQDSIIAGNGYLLINNHGAWFTC